MAFEAQAALTAEQQQKLPPSAGRKINFSQDIKPIFEASCVQCHGKGRDKGGFQVDNRETLLKGGDSGPAVVPGQSAQSLLIELVSGIDPDNIMPRKGSRLTAEQIGLLRAWIDQDLSWDSDITFARPAPRNLRPRAVPALNTGGENPVDFILRPYLERSGVQPPPVVGDAIFARRVYLDVIGLLPSGAELEAFVKDTHPKKRELLVKRLLSEDQAYAEHWLTFWNDLLRNDYRGTGYIDGGRKQISGWLFEALRTNMPYHHFVAQLIDPVPGSEGFTKGIVWRGVVNASQTPEMQAAQNISQVFMGVNLKCASCHDSLVNDWKLSDAYGLASVYSQGPLEMFQCDKPTGKTSQAAFIYPELGEIDAAADRAQRLKRLAEIITGPRDGRLSRTIVNRYWTRFFGRGLVEPVDDMERPAWNSDLLDWLAEDFVANGHDLRKTMERILISKAYQWPSVSEREITSEAFVFRGPLLRRISAEQFRDAVAQLTAVWMPKSEFPGVTNRVRAALAAADPLMTALGRPNREQVMTVRATAATTLQALELTNGESLAKVLRAGAQTLAAEAPAPAEFVDRVYRQALGRLPRLVEKEISLEVLGSPVKAEGIEDFVWAIAMLPEFQLIY